MTPMTKQGRLLFLGWLSMILAPLFMDWALNEQQENLTFSRKVREAEAAIPHGKTVGQAILTSLFVWLTIHFHWEKQLPGQVW